ncbi:MAG: cytochrome c3 family protein [Vicinamibacterales bacterium]
MSRPSHVERGDSRLRAARRIALCAVIAWLATLAPAYAQLGNLISPGRLAKAHANLEGLSNCQQCHEQGRKVTATKCLTCHKPVAERIARRVGVHKDVKAECETCHAEHAGATADLLRFNTATFDHARVTGFALDGKHANLAGGCAACHKQRSYLTLKTECATCHEDVHKGRMGASCQACHSTRMAFKDVTITTPFDHSKAAFQLTGAHRTVACEKCHVDRVYKGVAFSACTSCHKDQHRPAQGATCTTCHTTETWRTRRVEHARTAFALTGAHQKVDCVSCHKQSPMRVALKANTCATCHTDVHRGAFKQDCKACHNDTSFSKAPFDHTQTKFSLTGKHEALACERCHKNVATSSGVPAAKRDADFRGLTTTCVSCHADVHAGQLGATCETCHSSASFKVSTFTHQTPTAFFEGQHAALTCEKCHVSSGPTQPARTGVPILLNVQYRGLSTTCVSCHRDVHLGQEGSRCESCHTLTQPRFAVPGFSHATTAFALTGAHATVACAKCHKTETGTFPAQQGTAVRYKGIGQQCRACHTDVHLGQLDQQCESCHTVRDFHIQQYRHRNAVALSAFFVGRHQKAVCVDCHKSVSGAFPAGRGTAVRFAVDKQCVSCHADIHRGALGPNCAQCHRP